MPFCLNAPQRCAIIALPMSIWFRTYSLEALEDQKRNTLVEHLGIRITEIGDDYLVGTMPVDARTHQPMKILHGGASVALAETLGSTAANLIVDTRERVCVGQEINANHIRPVSSGVVTGTARPVHLGKRSQVWQIEIRDEKQRLVCISRITLAVVEREDRLSMPATG
jgi:1,4-dihydroxy-2-naphthoyl-CoA hydrolase